MRQANYDLEAARNDVDMAEWACYKCHQVKAALPSDSKLGYKFISALYKKA